MSRRRKIIIAVTACLLAGLLFAAFILPTIVRGQLEKQISIATERKCTVAGVAINPLTWSVEVNGARLSEKNSAAAFVSFSSLRLRVSPTSLWRLAPVVGELKVTAPYVHLRRDAPNSYNFSDILARNSKKKSEKPARFSLNNIIIENGRIEFADDALESPRLHRVEKLNLQIPFISNISYFADRYVDPQLIALVNGAALQFTGKLKPFDKGLEASLEINLQGLDIPYYLAYAPKKLPVEVTGGRLTTAVKVSHHLVQKGKPDIVITGTAWVTDLAISQPSGEDLFSLGSLDLAINRIALLQQRYEIAKLALAKPQLTVSRNRQGSWNFSRLKGDKGAAAGAGAAEPAAKPKQTPDLQLTLLQLTDGVVRFTDQLPPGGVKSEYQAINLILNNFGLKSEIPATYTLALQSSRKESASASGNLSMSPLAFSARAAVSGLVIEAFYPYLAALLADPVQGRADLSGDLAYSGESGLNIDQLLLRFRDVKVPFGKEDGARLPLLLAEGGSFSGKEQKVSFARIQASNGQVTLSRASDGKLSPALLLKEKPADQMPATPPAKGGRPFSWQIGSAALKGFKVSFIDRQKPDAPRFDLTGINATAAGITGPTQSTMPVTFSANYGADGRLSAKGRLTPAPFRFAGDVALQSFPFVNFDSYLPEGVSVYLLSGRLDTALALDLAMRDGRLAGTFRGDCGITDFYSVDAESETDLLKWESLALEGISGSLAPFALTVNGINLNDYYARVFVNNSGRLNLQEVYASKAKTAPPAPAVQPAAPAAPATSPPAEAASVRIDTVTFNGGILDFSDYHLNRDFSTTMFNLGGRVSGLSSDKTTAADIDLRGNLANQSPLKISGRINPLKNDLFLDMEIAFSEIELSPLTPYSGTYLGYAIDKGKLSLALKYKVENRNLNAENRVFLDQFTFGEKIESSKATSLPVRLGVALLKDRNGEIHLDLPLSGRTDSPKFSIWGLIGQVLKNLLVKAATSPFALLSSAFGGKDDFSGVAFASGTTSLSREETEKLQALAKVLQDRPGIRLEVAGYADRERDPEGYRNELLLRKMKNEKLLALAREKRESGVMFEAVEIRPEEYSKLLKTVYEKEKFPRPRTIIGTLKSLPDGEMKKLILANTAVSEQQLRGLARERTLAVQNFLLKEGKLTQDRLFEKSADPFIPAKDGKPGGRVEFGVVVK